jgi:hypothetical protein
VAVELASVTALMSIVDTTMTATNAADASAFALWIIDSEQPHIDGVNTYTAGAGYNRGIFIEAASGHVVIRNSWIYIAGPGFSVVGNDLSRLVSSTVNGATFAMVGRCDLVVDVLNNPYTCE